MQRKFLVLKKLGILFVLILLTIPFLALDYFWGGEFIHDFLKNQSLQIMGTILALNIATASFLVGHLIDIEIKLECKIFDASVNEIKENIYFMIFLFLLQLFILSFSESLCNINVCYWVKWLALVNLFLYLYCLYEITAALFTVRDLVHKKS